MDGRILFICGTLEAGKDGVGDYTRRLASELRSRGLKVSIIAARDKKIAVLSSDHESIRIPYATPAAERRSLMRRAILDFKPDWISLQYVPYSFNNRGIPLAFILELRALAPLGKWQVMFHELWIDENGLATPKDTAISLLQRWAITGLNRAVKPELRHTHLPAYQTKLLNKTHITSRPLPLFANIAPAFPAQNKEVREQEYRIGFFSQMELYPEVLTFIRQLKDWLIKKNRKLEIVLLGGSEDKMRSVAASLSRHFPDSTITPLGFLAEKELSKQLGALDLGITPVRNHDIGKSGTVAAFLNHGLPVAAPRVTEPGDSFFAPSLTEATLSSFSPAALTAATEAARTLDLTPITVSGVADRFLLDLGFSPHQKGSTTPVAAGNRNA